jgi:hypothetical protein
MSPKQTKKKIEMKAWAIKHKGSILFHTIAFMKEGTKIYYSDMERMYPNGKLIKIRITEI